jgi:hypothetical protein
MPALDSKKCCTSSGACHTDVGAATLFTFDIHAVLPVALTPVVSLYAVLSSLLPRLACASQARTPTSMAVTPTPASATPGCCPCSRPSTGQARCHEAPSSTCQAQHTTTHQPGAGAVQLGRAHPRSCLRMCLTGRSRWCLDGLTGAVMRCDSLNHERHLLCDELCMVTSCSARLRSCSLYGMHANGCLP